MDGFWHARDEGTGSDSTGVPPDRPGGVEHFVRELTVALEGRGYSTEVLHEENSVPTVLRSRGGKMRRRIAGNLLGYFVARKARRTWT